jgi:hypothetical protein
VTGSVCLLLLAAPLGAGSAPGTIDFPTSGAPAAEFVTGVLYLPASNTSGGGVLPPRERLDPGSRAYWGEALTYTHPIWDEQDATAGRGAWPGSRRPARCAPRRAPTGREQAYLDAAEALYGAGSKIRARHRVRRRNGSARGRYPPTSKKASRARAARPSQGVRDIPTYLRAAASRDRVPRQPQPPRPRYIIHAYDDPAHADRGLAAARLLEDRAGRGPRGT